MTAPVKSLNHMKQTASFNVIWDTGASISISPCKEDFIDLNQNVNKSYLAGVSSAMKVEGEGTVQWNMMDERGNIRNLKIKALYVPSCSVRLLRPHSITEKFADENINIVKEGLKLSGVTDDPARGPVTAYISKTNKLPMTSCFSEGGLKQAGTALNATISVVHESNLNLSLPQKHFLQWHWRLGHPSFNRLMYLLRAGVLSNTEASRRQVKSILTNVKAVPKCAGCMYGKQRRLPTSGYQVAHYHRQKRSF